MLAVKLIIAALCLLGLVSLLEHLGVFEHDPPDDDELHGFV